VSASSCAALSAAAFIMATRAVEVIGGLRLQRLMEMPQQAVQPVAEVALAEFAFEFLGLLQLELAQREEAVGAAAQVFIGAGRQPA
jgi:hypothetical protein